MAVEFFVGTVPERSESLVVSLSRFDDLSRATVIVDTHKTGGSWSNISTALGGCQNKRHGDWLVVLDDDVLTCHNFEHEAGRALDHCPDDASVVSLFWGWRSSPVCMARKRGASLIRTNYFVYGAAFAVRGGLVEECLAWNQKHVHVPLQVGDARVSYWAASTGRKCYGLVPSIVQHRPEMSSLAQNGRSNESFQAIWFVDDASEIEWNGQSIDYGKSGADLLRSHKHNIIA
jgi:hypothetical protein